MGTTPRQGIPYPADTDRPQDGALAMKNLAEAVDKLGFISELNGAAGNALPTVGAIVEATGTEVNIAAKPTARRYFVIVQVQFNLSAAGSGLYRAYALRDNAQVPTSMSGSVHLTGSGGGGQQSAVAFGTALVAANTAVQFSAGGVRAASGFAADSMTAAYVAVFDAGGI